MSTPGPRPSCWLALALLAGCSEGAPPAVPTTPGVEEPVEPQWPERYPAHVDPDDYAGAIACRPCHTRQHDEWRASPHGRAMALPAADTVLGAFDGHAVALPDGTVTPVRDGGRFRMEVRAAGRTTRHPVSLVLASGRQHQVYLTRDEQSVLRLLPILWSTAGDTWLPMSLYQEGALYPDAPDWWGAADIVEAGCLNCHLAQVTYWRGPVGLDALWVDRSVNCEDCHGPGRAHVERMVAGEPDSRLPDLRTLGQREEAQLCGRCHGNRAPLRLDEDAYGRPRFYARTLADPFVRPDGTQRLTGYQFSGHVMSRCYRGGALQCRHCHDPHSGRARTLDDRPAEGQLADRQCTVCHRNYAAPRAARAHSRHSAEVGCVPCHMGPSWIGDSPERQQRTADHTICTPRPRETLLAGIPNACNAPGCHADKSPEWSLAALEEWDQRTALGVRPWLEVVALARANRGEAAGGLLALLEAPDTGHYLRASALDLLGRLREDATLVPRLEPHASTPDPWERALALLALMRHDRRRARHWRRAGSEDPSPVARLLAFSREREPRALSPETLDRFEADSLAWRQRPRLADLALLVAIRAVRGELGRARALLDRLEAHASPSERTGPELRGLRARLEALDNDPRSRPWAEAE